MTETYTDIGPGCFTNGDVIFYKGENYYRACDTYVADLPEGGQEFCVKRVEHAGPHESYGGTLKEQ